MEATSREMPVGIQDFEKLRTEGCVYVDKTQYVYALSRISRPFFLGRPRRFGKSLLLSTMKAYFLGKKGLFEGLAIAGLEKEWIEYPVIMVLLRAYYAAIPYDLEDNKDKDEKYYQLIFYLLFTNMGQFVNTEVKSAKGRADAVVKTADSIYVFELLHPPAPFCVTLQKISR